MKFGSLNDQACPQTDVCAAGIRVFMYYRISSLLNTDLYVQALKRELETRGLRIDLLVDNLSVKKHRMRRCTHYKPGF